ncbi:MAG: ATP-binding cassette domain-containing protein [Gammaproteobacteria bacterium]|nr:ATP-binding cassette domain-containing protein [Gammaproteobacteria bacterium]MDH5630125.1 ATP-binding cassette domain-containing protein [Gammaproteobacteria bacterium]
MIRLKDLSLYQGAKLLVNQVDLTLYPNQKIGVIGANGCGKSSLFQLLQGKLSAEKGILEIPPKWTLAIAKQETPDSELMAIDYVLQGHREYTQLNQQLQIAEQKEDGHQIAEIHAKLEAIDGWRLPAIAAKLLTGLSFTQNQIETPVKALSGGWRMRLNLAQALLQPADLLLLDEPTNHLDLEAVLWLQDYLKSYENMLMVISHDRDFLDSFCSHTLHFENQGIDLYTGNYSSFEKQRIAKQELQQASFEKQQKQIKHLQSFIDRFKAKASKATQAQSRVKALEKMDMVSAVEIRSKFSFDFMPIDKGISMLADLEKVSVGYNSQPVLSNIDIHLQAGQRVGLLGRNGQGKSTLIKLICDTLSPLSGQLNRGKHFKPGYFAQHQLEQLNSDQSPIWHIQSIDPSMNEQQSRDFLGGFAFHGDKALEKVASFSGGEKARLVLAMIVKQAPNILLLDEPTNHFDLEMREALSLALQSYEGAVILVAHDRRLMESVVDEFWLVNDGLVQPFKGSIKDYQQWLKQNYWQSAQQGESDTNLKVENSQKNRKEQKRLEAENRQKKAPLVKKLNQVESKMQNIQQDLDQIEEDLADNSLYLEENKAKMIVLIEKSKALKSNLSELEEEWLELQAEIESLD